MSVSLPHFFFTWSDTWIFCSYPGLKDIRRIPNRPDIAFVEFESEGEATAARNGLNNFKIAPGQCMYVNYANK